MLEIVGDGIIIIIIICITTILIFPSSVIPNVNKSYLPQPSRLFLSLTQNAIMVCGINGINSDFDLMWWKGEKKDL